MISISTFDLVIGIYLIFIRILWNLLEYLIIHRNSLAYRQEEGIKDVYIEIAITYFLATDGP